MKRKGTNRRRVGTSSRSRINRLRSDIRGKRLVVGSDPPLLIPRPWNNASIEVHAKNDVYSFDFSALKDVAQAQLGLQENANNVLEFRIFEIRFWSKLIETNDDNRLEVAVYDFTQVGTTDTVATLTDISDKNHRAAVGYQFPMSWQAVALDATYTKNIFTIYSTKVYVRIKCVWRYRTPPPSVKKFTDLN